MLLTARAGAAPRRKRTHATLWDYRLLLASQLPETCRTDCTRMAGALALAEPMALPLP